MASIPRVMLIGDSIRMSYQPHVARLLEGKAEVVGPKGNCAHSAVTLEFLDQWVEDLGRPEQSGIWLRGHARLSDILSSKVWG